MHDGIGSDPVRMDSVLPEDIVREMGLLEPRPPAVLAPDSALQFFDRTIREAAAAAVAERWLECDGEGADGVSLHQVALDERGVLRHPLTGAIEPPERSWVVDGRAALEAFAGAWLPVPYLRVGPDGTVAGADGPTNWARVYVHAANAPNASRFWHIVLALDTAIEGHPDLAAGERASAVTAPTPDDVAAGTIFAFSADVNDIADFVVEPWVDDWLVEQMKEHRRRSDTAGGAAAATAKLDHLAHYLTLLAVLAACADLPDVRFRAAPTGRAAAAVGEIGLVLDIGATRTTALLAADTAEGRQALRHLPVRDLAEPWRVHEGLMTSRLRFSRAVFGREVYSRWSGRTNAFHWPSLVRVGREAARLAGEQDATDALTGLSSPIRHVCDDAPSRHLWRFAERSPAGTARRLPIVAGSLLEHVDEAGAVLDPTKPRPAATRPRFSRASVLTFFVAELVLQAVAAVNAPGFALGPHPGELPPALTRVVVAVPTAMQEAERERLRQRVGDAVTLVWRAMGWDKPAGGRAARPMPEVCLAGDATLMCQIAFVANEVEHKFRGRARAWFDIVGKPRTETGPGRVLRIATLDVGGATTSLAITGFDAGSTALATQPLALEAFRIGGEDVAKALIEEVLVPAVTQRLAEAKLADARLFLKELFASVPHGRASRLGDFKRRFVSELAEPAALALLREQEVLAANMDDRPAERTLRELIGARIGDTIAAADAFDQIAAEEGAELFQVLDTPVTFTAGEVTAIAARVLGPMLRHAVRAMRGYDCDIVLVGGGLGRLSVVREALLAGMPARPDRIVAMHQYRMGAWYPGLTASGCIEDAKSLPAVGAALVDGPELSIGGLPVLLEDLDPAAGRFLVGRLDAAGRLAVADVLFDSARPRVGQENGRMQQATLTVNPPVVLGMRRVPIESWPALPLFILDLAEAAAEERPRLPVKVTLEWSVDLAAGPPRVVRATDADGIELASSEIAIRLDTGGRAGGHWLDTGELTIA